MPLNSNIIRELAYSPSKRDTGLLQVKLVNPVKGENDHTFSLHRIVAIIALHYGISIFADGVLAELGINIQAGRSYDRHFEYRPIEQQSSDERRSIINALRVGDAHSRQCDVDHRCGRDHRHLHGLLYCAPTSHRMNTCFIHARKNAGHWCFGLLEMKYEGGVISSDVFQASVLDDIAFPSSKEVGRGVAFDGSGLE